MNDCIVASDFIHISVILDISRFIQSFRSDDNQDNDVGQDSTHQDGDYLAVIITLRLAVWRQWELDRGSGFDGGGSAGNEIAELIGRADEKGRQSGWAELDQMRRNDSPSSLNAEKLEEGGRDDAVVCQEAVRVQNRPSDDAGHDE